MLTLTLEVELTDFEALRKSGQKAGRKPHEQALFLLREALQASGYLKETQAIQTGSGRRLVEIED